MSSLGILKRWSLRASAVATIITWTVVGSAQETASGEQIQVDQIIVAEIVQRYEGCLETAKTRTQAVKKKSLHPKFFAALAKGCNRRRDAEIGIAQAKAGIADAKAKQSKLDAEISAITRNLLQGAKTELGITD